MSTLKKYLLIILVGLVVYIIWKPELSSKIPLLNMTTPKVEKFTGETKEEGTLQLTSPTLNPIEIKQIIKMKDTLVNPFTSIGTHPNNNEYQNLADLDFKNLQAYLANLLQEVVVDGIKFKVIPTSISPNVYIAYTTNLAYLTPIEIQGNIMVNDKSFGEISLMIILRGSTNSIYVPNDGVFMNGKKYKMYVENVTVNSVTKSGAPENKQKGFYAVADSIDMRVTGEQAPENKKPQEIKLDRINDNN
jgi:hypothetical protein